MYPWKMASLCAMRNIKGIDVHLVTDVRQLHSIRSTPSEPAFGSKQNIDTIQQVDLIKVCVSKCSFSDKAKRISIVCRQNYDTAVTYEYKVADKNVYPLTLTRGVSAQVHSFISCSSCKFYSRSTLLLYTCLPTGFTSIFQTVIS